MCPTSNPDVEAIFKQFFGRIQKQFSSSSLVESRSSFQAVLRSNPEAIFKQFFGRIQKQFSSSSLVESRSNFQAVLWSNPDAIFKVLWPNPEAIKQSNPEAIFKQFFGRIQKQFSSSSLAESRCNFQAFFFFAFFDCFI